MGTYPSASVFVLLLVLLVSISLTSGTDHNMCELDFNRASFICNTFIHMRAFSFGCG